MAILMVTHSQISQVIREYRKTTYQVPMAVLGVLGDDNVLNARFAEEVKDDSCSVIGSNDAYSGTASLPKKCINNYDPNDWTSDSFSDS
ncbi:hypothetical protein L1049_027561 [Liquidambar formosana]|uniref:Uncharacterized protein n=1 Tax=Liquidambar formosana TaxID=63359 RepID=A0AAP0WSM4_LIQFO